MIQGVFQDGVFRLVERGGGSLDLFQIFPDQPIAFETMRGDLRFLEDHVDRLWRSVGLLSMDLDNRIDRALVVSSLQEVAAANRCQDDLRIKIQVMPQEFAILVQRINAWPEAIKVRDIIFERPNPQAKYETKDYGVMGKKAKDLEVDEIIYTDAQGCILEGSVTNVFFVIEGVLVTPLQGFLPGIMREKVIQKAYEKGFSVEMRDILLAEKEKASEIFVTNSLRGIVPVKAWGGWQCDHGDVIQVLSG